MITQEQFDKAWRDLQISRQKVSAAWAEMRKWEAIRDEAQAIVNQATKESNERSDA